jgi:hypothetical protein
MNSCLILNCCKFEEGNKKCFKDMFSMKRKSEIFGKESDKSYIEKKTKQH